MAPALATRCDQVRHVVAQQIDWPCEIKTSYQSDNLGCRRAVTWALDWFFDQVEEGVILEDDVVPTKDFFEYCSVLLAHYRFDSRVGCISGNCFLPKNGLVDASYYFSNYTHSWGWATWRRAWSCYDRDMKDWRNFSKAGWLEIVLDKAAATYWRPLIEQVYLGIVDTWDLIWLYSCWKSGFLTCIASAELVENIGFGADATHTLDETSPLRPTQSLMFPLLHPTVMQARRDLDAETLNSHYRQSWRSKLLRKCRKIKRIVVGR